MTDLRRGNCIICGLPESEVGPISWRGKCRPCGLERERQTIRQLANHSGPIFRHWRERVAASVGAEIVDAPRTQE